MNYSEKEIEKRKEIIVKELGYDNPKDLKIGDKIKVINYSSLISGNYFDNGKSRFFNGFFNNGDLKVNYCGRGQSEIFEFWKKFD